MRKLSPDYVRYLFIISIISIIIDVILVSLIFALSSSGFGLSVFSPGCSLSYHNIKLGYSYAPMRAHTICAVIATLASIGVLIILIKINYQENIPKDRKNVGYALPFEYCCQFLYILTALHVVCLLPIFGGKLSFVVDNAVCQVFDSGKLITIFVLALLCFLVGLVEVIFAIILDLLSEKSQPINIRSLKNNQLRNQQEQMSKHFQVEAKEYISNNIHQKEEIRQNLMQRQQAIYGQSGRKLSESYQSDNDMENQPQQFQKPQAYPSQNIKTYSQSIPQSQFPTNSKKETSSPNNQNQTNSPFNYIQTYQQKNPKNPNNQIDQQNEKQVQLIKDENLNIKEDENISQKFQETKFQLDYKLEKAIKNEKDQELSPYQLKQLMNLSKEQFQLTKSNKKTFSMTKSYDNPNYKINLNFALIKPYKQKLKRQRQRLIDHPQGLQNNEQEQDEQGQKKKQEDKPISDEVTKILKMTLFNNSQFYKKPQQIQYQCPINKFIQRDEGFDIVQSNDKSSKNKKFQYTKQKVMFTKKRKENNDNQQNLKNNYKQDFNEGEYVKMERLILFGTMLANEEKAKADEQNKKNKKRKLVDTIRSKYSG